MDKTPRGTAFIHLRRRLDRWNLCILPGHRPARAEKAMRIIGKQLTPKVLAAYIRLICNGWCTSRRFQGRLGCRFGCGGEQDSVEHFAYCSKLRTCFSRDLCLTSPALGYELDEFLCMCSLNSAHDHAALTHAIVLRAVACYATFRAHNGLRCGDVSAEHWEAAFSRFVREGLQGYNIIE